MLVGISGGENLIAWIVVADYLSLVPLIWETCHFEKQKCQFVVGIEEVAEGKDLEMVGQGCLEMDVINLGTNYQLQTNTLFRNVWFFIRYEMKVVWKGESG